MSVNGDSTIRHGRSQISIYDYPEHLNPFYEDENHKRIRFWKIGKSKDDNGRRNSFSLGGLKDMWAFKSFRLKKKSSSLGINKTSESPPPLRRQLDSSQCSYGTYDPRMRHTTTTNGGYSNTFDRNTSYRSSLQDMRLGPRATQQQQQQQQTQNGIGFARNDRYRSTIQTPQSSNYKSPNIPPRRYVYGGSVTPQPIRNKSGYKCNDDYEGIHRGSSQVSISSSNPFEDNDDDDVVIAKIENDSVSPKKRYAHKKKRAPPPPPFSPLPVEALMEEAPSNDPTEPKNTSHLYINEEEYLPIDEILNISSLTAEIENFVQTSKDDSPNSNAKSSTKSIILKPNINLIETISCEEKKVNLVDKRSDYNSNHNTVIVSEPLVERNLLRQETDQPSTIETSVQVTQDVLKGSTAISNIEIVDTDDSNVVLTKNNLHNKTKTNFEPNASDQTNNNIATVSKTMIRQEDQLPHTNSIEEDTGKCVIGKSDVIVKKDVSPNSSLLFKSKETEQTVLKITENPLQQSESTKNEHIPVPGSFDKTETLLFRPKESPPKPPKLSFDCVSKTEDFPLKPLTIEKDLFKNKINDSNKEQIAPVSKERRRSVRDIIESINRNQKLLKINKEVDPEAEANKSKYIFYTNNINEAVVKAPPRKKIEQNYRSLEESEKEIKRLLQQMESPLNSTGNNIKNSNCYGNEHNETLNDLIDQLNQNNDNNNANLFEKCTLKKDIVDSRESSPTISNLDWNPVPKPKRTKNLSPEFKLDNNHSGNNNCNNNNFTFDNS